MAQPLKFTPATRKRVKAKIAIVGPSGSGKTWQSILFARGLVGDEGRIALADTEAGSASSYTGLGATKLQPSGFDTLDLGAPFTVERYVDVIEAAEAAKYEALIMDQISWLWDGPGGLLDQKDILDESGKGSSFTNWRKITPDFNAFVQRILLSPMHIICTMRAKSEWAVNNEDGKAKPVKLGIGPIQRPGIEFEFFIAFDINMAHGATVSKDRSNLFGKHKAPLTIADGDILRQWLLEAPEAQVIGAAQKTPEEITEEAKATATGKPVGATIDKETAKKLIAASTERKMTKEDILELMSELAGVSIKKTTEFPASLAGAYFTRLAEDATE